MKNLNNYPFIEGQKYYIIEENYIIESIWDEQSEIFYNENKMYFKTLKEAEYFYKYIRNAEMLDSALDFIRFSNATDVNNFLEGFEYFNDNPKYSLL